MTLRDWAHKGGAMAKSIHDRREFMGLAGASVAASAQAFAAVAPQEPDLVVLNGRAYTVDPIVPQAEAFAVKADRFVAVGSSEEVRSLIGPRTQTLDAEQMTIVPGFIDAHNHAPGAILLYEVLVGNPYDVEFVTIASIIDKLRARARETPAGFWVEGFFFDDTKVKDPSSIRSTPRRSYHVLQQQGLRIGRNYK
jgi:predicted amidohydrolase YtcJ